MSRGALSGKGGSAKYANLVLSGGSSSGGALAEFYEITGWKGDFQVALPEHSSNATEGVKDNVFGIRSSSGSFETKVHAVDGMPFGPGQLVQLQLDAGNGKIPKTLGVNYIQVTARIEGVPVDIQLDGDGQSIALTYNWKGCRPWVGYGIFAKLWVVEGTDT